MDTVEQRLQVVGVQSIDKPASDQWRITFKFRTEFLNDRIEQSVQTYMGQKH